MASLVKRVAGRLGLPFHAVVTKVRETQPQAEMDNSAQQLRNVEGAFAVNEPVTEGPALLLDDLVDSRWTLTAAVQALRAAATGPVFAVALARSQGD